MSFGDFTAADYGDLLRRLLPRGKAWRVVAAANGLPLTVDALAPELARAHNRLLDVIDESDPRTAVELLDAWERVLGLPDPCDPSPPTLLADRQAAAFAKMIARGGTQLSNLDDVIAAAGYDGVEVQQSRPFLAGFSTADSRVYDGEWMTVWYVWRLTTPAQGWARLLCLLTLIAPSYSEPRAIDVLAANAVDFPT